MIASNQTFKTYAQKKKKKNKNLCSHGIKKFPLFPLQVILYFTKVLCMCNLHVNYLPVIVSLVFSHIPLANYRIVEWGQTGF